MRRLKLSNATSADHAVLVDDSDIETLSRYRWRLTNRGYAEVMMNRVPTKIHDYIASRLMGMPIPPGHKVTHKDGNRLNDQRSNLEVTRN
jgi:hypothetical protein